MPEEIQLTPEQAAQYNQVSAPAPAESTLPVEINPIRDFDANQLAELAVKDKEGFDLVGEFRRNEDLWANPAVVQKTADALNIVKQRGFELSDLPGPKKIGQTVLESAKGFGKQLWNYGSAAVGIIQGAIAEPFSSDLATGFAEGVTEKLAKNIAGTEEAMAGLSQIPGKAVRKIGQATGLAKDFNQFTPEEKLSDLWKDVGVSEVQQSRVTGQGPFTQAVTGGAAGELPAEEVSTLAAGDPFSFVTFSKGFQLAGKAIPGAVRGAISKTGEQAGEVAATVGGRATQAGGNLTELGSKAVQAVAPAAGLVKGAIEAGPVGALAGLKAGEIAASVAKRVSTAGAKVAEAGKQVAGVAPVTSSLAQAGRDILQAAPGAAGTTAIGLGQDIGLSALTSETPAETQGAIGIGTALGAAGAVGRVGRRVISGQLVAPREYGVSTVTPSSGNFPTLDVIHSDSIREATPGEKTRLNAIRLFAKGATPGTDIIFASDAAALTQTLTDLGIAPDTAAQFAQQEGFFTQNLPDKNGNVRPVIIVRNLDAAPHEAFHAVQDVLGEAANRELDNVVRQEYADQWENEGNRYATRLVGDLAGRDWRETILDESGWGHAESMEKLSNAVANEVIGQSGAEPTAGFVADRVRADWRRIYEAAQSRNPAARPEQVWREILSPEESAAVADRYIARELAAENFDIVFKNLGAALDTNQPLVRKLAGVAAKLISTLGGEPLAGRRSDIGQIEPRFGVTEAVTVAARGREAKAPVVEPKSPRQPVSVPRTVEEAADAATVARDIASSAPETARERLGAISEAIAQRAGVKINYLSAPGEPAAATTSNRVVRREIIEAFRTMPPEARSLWEKNFFPERVIRTKAGKYQILGWAPEVFASNAHKLAGWLADHPNLAVPYAIDTATKSFTPDAWQQLFADTQQFVRNQQAGATGAGETLVVPENIRERGFTAPARTGQESPLAQDRADVINMLFGFKLPETPRIQKGRLPLAIVGEEISAATQPGRVEVPVRPRGEFTGIEAAAQDIAGRPIQEVNPFRNAVEAAGNPPSLIEAVQRLNLENIKEVAIASEQPEFRGNTLTLTAGFQPSAHPRAVDKASVRDEQGRIFTGAYHGEAMEAAKSAGSQLDYGDFDTGFVDKQGNWLTRAEAFKRAEEINQLQLPPPEQQTRMQQELVRQGLESVTFGEYRQFQPIKEEMAKLPGMTQEEWKTFTDSYRSPKYGAGLTGWAFDLGASAKNIDDVSALRSASQTLSAAGREAMKAGRFDDAMSLISRGQAAREAFEAATGRTLDGTQEAAVPFIREHFDPNYNPPVPPAGDVTPVKVAAQPIAERQPRVGTEFTKFFTDVTKGTFGKSDKPFVPTKDLSELQNVIETKTKHSGNFDDHIAKSIPTFYETQIQKAKAIADSLPEGGRVLDIAASEGSFGKTISELSDGTVETVSLDPNEAMAGFFETKSQVPGATYVKEAFLNGFESDGVNYVAHDGGPYDVVTESMGFQFIDPDRAAQISEAKRLLKPNGVFLTEQKVRNSQWAANEKKKDTQFKSKYFSTDELAAKDQKVGFAQSKDEVKSVGMVDNMADQQSLEDVLTNNFKHVVQYWDAGNFKGYAASDNAAELNRIVERMGDTNSEFSTEQMPRQVEPGAREDFEFQARQQSFQPANQRKQLKFAKTSSGGFKKAWVLPSGEPVQLGGTWHHEWLADNPDVAKKYKLDVPEFTGNDTEQVRENALRAGFARINYGVNNGTLTVEARARDWRKVKNTVEDMVSTNLDDIDNIRVTLFDEAVKEVVDADSSALFNMDSDQEKLAAIPFITKGEIRGRFQPKSGHGPRKVEENQLTDEQDLALRKQRGTLLTEIHALESSGKNRKKLEGLQQQLDSIDDQLFSADVEFTAGFNEDLRKKLENPPGPKEIKGTKITLDDFDPELDRFGPKDSFVGPAWVLPDGSGVHVPIGAMYHDDAVSGFLEFGGDPKDVAQNRGAMRVATFDSPRMLADYGNGHLGISVTRKPTEAQVKHIVRLTNERIDNDNPLFDLISIDIQDDDGNVLRGENFKSFEKNKAIRYLRNLGQGEPSTAQFQPKRGDQENLFDLPEPTDFPEAVRARKEVPSNLVGSPRAKQFSKQEDAVTDFADRLVEEAKRQEGNPAFQIGKRWYSEFTPLLKKEFDDDAPLMAELLAATSPKTNVETNFGYAIDVLNNWKAGKFDKLISKLNEGYKRLEDGSLAKIYRRDVRAGKVESPPENPSDATYVAWWILKHDLLPRGTSGAQVGLHSKNVAKVLTRRWLSETKGPKTKNFVQNLIGTGDEATIDIWADRLLRRIGYEGFVERWRIKPENVKGVADDDFEFGQQVFRAAADRLGMKPSDLQAALWFTEKQRWADNKWSDKLDLGDFRTEIKRTEEYRRGFAEGKGPAEVRGEAKRKSRRNTSSRPLTFSQLVVE